MSRRKEVKAYLVDLVAGTEKLIEERVIRIVLPNGKEIRVELFERHDRDRGQIEIRTIEGQLHVVPRASNVVAIRPVGY